MLFLSTSSRVDLIIINLSRLLYFVTRFSLFFVVVNYGWEHETHSSSAIVGLLLKIQKSISFLPNTRIHPGNFSGKKAARVGKKETEYRALRWTKVNGGDDDGLPDRTNHRPEEDASLLKRAGPAAAAARDHRWMDGGWICTLLSTVTPKSAALSGPGFVLRTLVVLGERWEISTNVDQQSDVGGGGNCQRRSIPWPPPPPKAAHAILRYTTV